MIFLIQEEGFENDDSVTNNEWSKPCERSSDREQLQVEVVHDVDGVPDTRTSQQVLQDVVNTCIALQGSLVTRDVSLPLLITIESTLKDALATCASQKLRRSGYPVTIASMNTIQRSPSVIKRSRKEHNSFQHATAADSTTTLETNIDAGDQQTSPPVYQLINFRTDPPLDQNCNQDAPFVLTLHDQPQLITFHKFMSKKDTGRFTLFFFWEFGVHS